jgi:hypothetical protein
MASASNLSVPHSRNNPAPTVFGLELLDREMIVQRRESHAAFADSLSRFAAGLLFGFAGAYIVHSPLTVGHIAILAAIGVLFLCKDLLARKLRQ